MKYFAVLLLLGLASATTQTNRKNFTVYGIPPASQYYGYYATAPAYYTQPQGSQQQRAAGRPLQIRDVYDKPVLALVPANDSAPAGQLKGCVLPQGLASLPTELCTRDAYQQLLQTPEDQHALLFDPYNADIERLYRFKNYTVSRFQLPNNTRVANLAHALAVGLPTILICQDEYCAEGVRQAYTKKLAELTVGEDSVEVSKSYEPSPTVLYATIQSPAAAFNYPAAASNYPAAAAYQPYQPYPAIYPQGQGHSPAAGFSYYPQGAAPFAGFGAPQYVPVQTAWPHPIFA